MKKLVAILLYATLGASLAACGGKEESKKEPASAPKYENALEILTTIADFYKEDDKFPMAGGDAQNMTTDGPGNFDITQTEELVTSLTFPESQLEHIDDAASLVHMMNANIFTGASYHLTDDTDLKEFTEDVKESVLTKQWICGMPDTLLIIQADDDYVVTAYGNEEVMDVFKEHATSSLEDSEILLETSVTGN